MNTALVVIDIQMDYFPGGAMELSGSEAAAAKAGRALGWFREKGWPVIHVQHLAARSGAAFLVPGTPGVEFHPFVAPKDGETVIQKHFPNSFRGTALQDKLDEFNVKRLCIVGMMTHMCVDATTRAAFDLGYQCVVLADACATRELEFGHVKVHAAHVQASFMAALAAVYADVTGVKDMAASLG
ncbi:cysteine hydrolase family protein [Fundidesulfovibrio terrae]|uniref:cysteine hydrolase family protein n=1 Tax=Fundidesulfovibrio terrae TaxID=2922866 RepID=UPI001FAFDF5D